MATVTKPLALNESLNTTENTPRNIADVLAEGLSEIADNLNGYCLVLTASSVSSLPATISNANITSDMVCINSTLSNHSAQLSDWTVTTSNGSVSISGTISGTTNITLYLSKSR